MIAALAAGAVGAGVACSSSPPPTAPVAEPRPLVMQQVEVAETEQQVQEQGFWDKISSGAENVFEDSVDWVEEAASDVGNWSEDQLDGFSNAISEGWDHIKETGSISEAVIMVLEKLGLDTSSPAGIIIALLLNFLARS